MTTTDLTPILQRLDTIAAQVAYVAERQRKQEELFEEMMPIAREAMAAAIARLDQLDKDGTLAFAGELVDVGKKIVEAFSPDDVRQLGDAVVGILDTVRSLTQPEVLHVAADAAAAMQDADDVKPMGIFGMVRATRNDDVQKGMALMVEMLRRVGHGVSELAARRDRSERNKDKLAAMLGPSKRRRGVLGIERKALPARAGAATPPPLPVRGGKRAGGPACAAPAAPAKPAAVIDGVAFSADGHMVDAAAWTRSLGEALATVEGVTLTDAHWAVLEAARKDFAETQASPNIRRLTNVAGVSTKDLYTLFPKAPGRTIAKIAGLPRPVGCL
ncbi:MAG: TusE/DsrC/DsvC family sulfur relay protein [Kofleriaceae bacterium]|nr:TusE/DsrC/DsvC family sulfur relay protein [Kofleriaceae bacterium]